MAAYKRDLNDFAFDNSSFGETDDSDGSARKRKRKSRWATEEDDKTFIPGMPTVLPSGLEKDQEELYLLQLQIEEVSRRLRTGDLGIPTNPEERSPSPEPIYNNEGKRLNTREYRTRKKLEEQRHELIQKCCDLNTEYKPPSDYKPPIVRVTDKVMIPQDDHPDINFVGLLIGPRGNTLKNLEKDTGAKIIIRGKGSVKEGKIGRKDGQPLPGEDEPLHAYITANNPEFVKKAAIKIRDIIQQGIEVPEQQNDLRRQQLRELALLNGTLRENDGLMKLKQLQQAQTIITNTIICTKCGGTGHLGQDCKQARPSDTLRSALGSQESGSLVPSGNMGIGGPLGSFGVDKAKMDSEYSALMAELGEGPPSGGNSNKLMANSSAANNHFGGKPSNFSHPPPGAPHMPPHSRPPMNLPPPMNPPPHHSNSIPPPQMGMSQPHSMSMASPPPLMSQQTHAPSGGPLPWQQNNHQFQQPPGMTPSSSANGMSQHNLPPPPPPPSGNLPPWQQGPQHNYPPPPAPWHQQGPPSHMSHPGGMRPPWHHGPGSSSSMPPHMMPPPPPPGHQGYNASAPPPPPPSVAGGNDAAAGLPTGIPLGVPPPPPPS